MLHKAAYRYQLSGWVRPVLIFYLVIVCIYLVLLFEIPFIQAVTGDELNPAKAGANLSGMEISSAIFIFVVGICSFREEFRFLSQNGCSRRTVFCSWLAAAGSAVMAMAVIDTVLTMAFAATAHRWGMTIIPLFQILFGTKSSFFFFFGSVALSFSLYAAAVCFGHFINIAYYRMSKGWKIGVSIIVPAFFLICLPLIDAFASGHITKVFLSVVMFFLQSAGCTALTCLLTAAVLILGCWLMLRRAAVKPPSA